LRLEEEVDSCSLFCHSHTILMGNDLIDDLVGCNLDQVFFLQECVDDVIIGLAKASEDLAVNFLIFKLIET